MEGVPERQGLEATRGGAGQLERDLHRVRTAGREENLVEIARRQPAQRFGQFDRRLAGKATWGEAEIVQLSLDRRLQPRMTVADVMDTIAMKIHVAATGGILDPDTLSLGDGGNAGARQALVQEGFCVSIEQLPGSRIVESRRPCAPRDRRV